MVPDACGYTRFRTIMPTDDITEKFYFISFKSIGLSVRYYYSPQELITRWASPSDMKIETLRFSEASAFFQRIKRL